MDCSRLRDEVNGENGEVDGWNGDMEEITVDEVGSVEELTHGGSLQDTETQGMTIVWGA